MDDMMLAIEVVGLSKTFLQRGKAPRQALRNLSLTVAPGEMVALIGASGSGKSTLLRHIAGLASGDRCDSGRVLVVGEPIQERGRLAHDVRRRRSRIGVIFQQFNLVGRLPVLTNVLTGTLSRVPLWRSLFRYFTRPERQSAFAALVRVGIGECALQRASTLSGGQQQRAAIARALVQHAEILLADEPIASLDPESARRVMDILAAINRDDRVTVLVSLHQIDYARRYCPRTVALKDGAVVYDGPTEALTAGLLHALYGADADQLEAMPAPRPVPEARPARAIVPLRGFAGAKAGRS
jgi:phosphonate transport system ATP-binding protein